MGGAPQSHQDDIVTAPGSDQQSFRFEDLFELEEIQKIQDQFAKATGVASIITHVDGTPITEPSNFCRLCRDIIRSSPKGLQNCYKSDAALGKMNPAGPLMQPCLSGGLWDGGAAISVGGNHIANWLIGQVRNDTQTIEKMLEYAREIEVDEKEFEEALLEVPIMSTEQFSEVCKALFLIADQLSQVAYQNAIQRQIIAEREQAQEALAKAQLAIRSIVNSMPSILIGVKPDLSITLWNSRAAEKTGRTLESVLGQNVCDVIPTLTPNQEGITKAIHRQEVAQISGVQHGEGKDAVFEDLTVFPLDGDGETTAVIRIDDVTEQTMLERQLAQSRKMDAIGQLAGGIAHDFNNMLCGIMGAADILSLKLVGQEAKYVNMILNTCERAGDLTSKLLAFSRKGPSVFKPLELHELVNNTLGLLEGFIDRRIEIHKSLQATETKITGDASLLQNLFLNLGINASQAMRDGGTLTVSSQNIYLDRVYCETSHFDVMPGTYIQVSMKDTGCGIPYENLDTIFEPFFTTKAQDEGTGLGLAAVYGTVLDHHGAVAVYSELGEGTVFHIYLPLSEEGALLDNQEDELISGSGHILVVDDEDIVRITAETILESLEYTVTTACNGQEAVEIFEKDPDSFDLVILDMAMPKMNGHEAFYRLRKIRPDVKVIISSGFSRNEDLDDLRQHGLCAFIQKPYRQQILGKQVAAVISQK